MNSDRSIYKDKWRSLFDEYYGDALLVILVFVVSFPTFLIW
ncbi:hypothetical protein [Nostoc sp. PCC 7524]|nr:hypothetical protein [Nostoc sp. PCC 7524]